MVGEVVEEEEREEEWQLECDKAESPLEWLVSIVVVAVVVFAVVTSTLSSFSWKQGMLVETFKT